MSAVLDEVAAKRAQLRAQLVKLDEIEARQRGDGRPAEIPLLIDLADAVALNLPRSPVSFGIAPLDHMLGGGIDRDEALVIGGAPGSFKTSLVAYALPFLATPRTAVLFVAADEPSNRVARKIGVRYGETWGELCSDYPPVVDRLRGHLLKRDVFARITHPRATYTIERALDAFDREAPKDRQRIVILDHIQSVSVDGPDAENEKAEIERVVSALIDGYVRGKGWSLVALSEVTKAALFAPVVTESPMSAFAGTRKIVSRFDAALVLVPDGEHRVRCLPGKSRFGPRTPWTLEWNTEHWTLTHVSDGDIEVEKETKTQERQRKKSESQTAAELTRAAKGRDLILGLIRGAKKEFEGVPLQTIRGAWNGAGAGSVNLMAPLLSLMVHEGLIESYERIFPGRAGAAPTYYRTTQIEPQEDKEV